MKIDSLIYAGGAIAVIVGAAMKILHLPYANLISYIGLVGVFLFMILKRDTAKKEK